MSRQMLGRIACVVGLVGTVVLASGCGGNAVDKTGPATPPGSMSQDKQKQYEDFMKSKGMKGGGGGTAPGGAAPGGKGGAPAPTATMPHG